MQIWVIGFKQVQSACNKISHPLPAAEPKNAVVIYREAIQWLSASMFFACARGQLNPCKLQQWTCLNWVLVLLVAQSIRSASAQPTHQIEATNAATSARSLLAVSPQPPAPPATYQVSVQLQWSIALATTASTVPTSQVEQVLNELASLSGGWLVDYTASLSPSPPSPPSPNPPWPPPGKCLLTSMLGVCRSQLASRCCKHHARWV
jgi:hypothetical protein